jgi:hypothetical protein
MLLRAATYWWVPYPQHEAEFDESLSLEPASVDTYTEDTVESPLMDDDHRSRVTPKIVLLPHINVWIAQKDFGGSL